MYKIYLQTTKKYMTNTAHKVLRKKIKNQASFGFFVHCPSHLKKKSDTFAQITLICVFSVAILWHRDCDATDVF